MEIKEYGNLTVLVAGCGSIGKRHIDILKKLGVGKIVVCDPSENALKAISDKYPDVSICTEYEKGLECNPFAVFILTPTKMHIPMAIKAIENGAHVFIEKPLSNSSEGITELKEIAQKYGKQVMVGFCMRYHKALLEAKHMLDAGRIGRLVSIRAMVGEDFPSIHPEYKEMYLCKYSGVFELVHDIDLAIWYAGLPIKEVYGSYGALSDYEFEAPDTVEMIIRFEDKCMASVHLDFFENPRRRSIELIGTEGIIIVEFASWDQAVTRVYQKNKGCWEESVMATERNDMFIDEDDEFLRLALDNKPMHCNIDEAAKSLLAVEKIYKPY